MALCDFDMWRLRGTLTILYSASNLGHFNNNFNIAITFLAVGITVSIKLISLQMLYALAMLAFSDVMATYKMDYC